MEKRRTEQMKELCCHMGVPTVICFLSSLTFSVTFVVSPSYIPILCSHAECM